MLAPVDAFKWRPTGEHPRYLRMQSYRQLAAPWHRHDDVRMLCPPTELAMATVLKLRESGAPAILLVPH